VRRMAARRGIVRLEMSKKGRKCKRTFGGLIRVELLRMLLPRLDFTHLDRPTSELGNGDDGLFERTVSDCSKGKGE
jgi:hypothetical protein